MDGCISPWCLSLFPVSLSFLSPSLSLSVLPALSCRLPPSCPVLLPPCLSYFNLSVTSPFLLSNQTRTLSPFCCSQTLTSLPFSSPTHASQTYTTLLSLHVTTRYFFSPYISFSLISVLLSSPFSSPLSILLSSLYLFSLNLFSYSIVPYSFSSFSLPSSLLPLSPKNNREGKRGAFSLLLPLHFSSITFFFSLPSVLPILYFSCAFFISCSLLSLLSMSFYFLFSIRFCFIFQFSLFRIYSIFIIFFCPSACTLFPFHFVLV